MILIKPSQEKIYRVPVLNGMMRLLWTYLYRCHEPLSTSSAKLDTIFKQIFPQNRLTIITQEEHLQPFICIVHFVLSRHFDVGSEFCLDLLQERLMNSQSGPASNSFSPDRITIATQAILLSLNLIEREEQLPSWPSSADFSAIPSPKDYPSSSTPLPATIASKASWSDFLDRSTSCLSLMAVACYQAVGKWSVLDEQWATTRLGPTYEEAHNYIIRRHPEGSVAYSDQYAPHIHMLQIIFQSWPRCLHSSLALEEAFDMLIRGVIHIEPSVGEAAILALQRFMAEPSHVSPLLKRFSSFLFAPTAIVQEGFGFRLPIDCNRLLNLWFSFVERWISEIKRKPFKTWTSEETEDVLARAEETESGALFLLASTKPNGFTTGVKVVRSLKVLMDHMRLEPFEPSTVPEGLFALIEALFEEDTANALFRNLDEVLEGEELNRLVHWKTMSVPHKLVRLAGSEDVQDRALWKDVFPILVQGCSDPAPSIVAAFREKLVAAAARGTSLMQQLSGVSSRVPSNAPQRSGSSGDGQLLVPEHQEYAVQWWIWVKVICATASVSDSRPPMGGMRDHSRARSEAELGPEQMQTTHDLFWALCKFLDTEFIVIRDTAVSCISSFPANGYSQLLEDLSKLQARQHYDDPRTKGAATAPMIGRLRRQERFLAAVARIYFLTAHLLRDQRSSGKQAALTYVLKYVRNMHGFLISPENRDRWFMQRLRRYFCGTIERVFDALATLKDSDRFIPHNLYLALYTMCEEWCQLGKQSDEVKKRLVHMQTMAAKSFTSLSDQAGVIQKFQTETRLLSHAAISAIAAVCVSEPLWSG